ncbi:MAG: ATP-binding cassette domain-containing protein, partial [Gemmatimonadota bacterium]
MIQIQDLALQVGDFRLSGVSLELPTGGHGLIIGPTGSGKTTLLEAIAGHLRPTAGRIVLDGQDVTRIPPEERGIGFVYQAYHLFPHYSVRENVAYGLGRTKMDATAI